MVLVCSTNVTKEHRLVEEKAVAMTELV
jgi:hypothetical protein